MVAPSFHDQPGLARVLSPLVLAGLLAVSVPVSADHLQTDATRSIQFDHRTGNEWWVEVMLGGRDAASVQRVDAMDLGGPWTPLTKRSWGPWAGSFHIEPGHQVLFRATWPDGVQRESCWFNHPSGVEDCSADPETFDAHFSGVRGNEWWVQGYVNANGPVSKVDVTLDDGATWRPLSKQSWGGWAASYHIVQGTVVRLRATSGDGQSDLSSCRQWIPPANQDAQVVACPGSPGFDATFTGVKGNEWWVQANVAGNQPIAGVAVRVDCAPQWRPMELQSWGGWTASFHIPPGSKVDFQARSNIGAVDASGGYTWTAATAAPGCALGAWPKDGSMAVYQMSGGVCGGGECFNGAATLTLTYRGHQWTGVCNGTDTHTMTDGSAVTGHYTQRLDIAPLFERANTQVGSQHQVAELSTFYQGGCTLDDGRLQTVVGQEDYVSGLKDASGNPVTIRVWDVERNNEADGENYYVTHWDTDLGMVLDLASHPRRSQQGSWWTQLTDTDAPVR